MMVDVQVTPTVIQLGTHWRQLPSWAQRRHNMGSIASTEASSTAKKRDLEVQTGILRISDCAGYVTGTRPVGPYHRARRRVAP
jgi:hypothetical protein